ncbi:MAG TPA: hypothetical protein PKI62_00345 [bacterium]|nr:hypothetical protein [bacterium]HPR87145.1 hypothetical protein [bacterium]
MLTLHFDLRDLFRAPRLALSLQRMWIMLAGLGMGWLIYALLTYLGLIAAGGHPGELWRRFGILPLLAGGGAELPWYSWLLHGLGAVAAFAITLLAHTAVARAVYMSAKGEHFYSWRQAYNFAWRKFGAVIMTPLALGLLILLFMGGGFLIGLLGRIPWAGELGMALFTLLWFAMALLLIFIGLVFGTSLFLAPAIVATTDEDAFEAIFQLFALTWREPWRLLLYGFVSLFFGLAALGIFAAFCKEAVVLTNYLFAYFMGSNFADLANNGQALVQAWSASAEGIIFTLFRGFTPYLFFTQEFYYLPVQELARPTVAVAGYLYACGLLLLGGWILSYGFATLDTGAVLSYLALRKRKDGVNLLERKDKEEESEEEEVELGISTEEPAAEQN